MAPTTKRTASESTLSAQNETTKKVAKDSIDNNEDPAVTLFRDYLRIKSVQPDPDYDSCNVFLKKQAERLGLDYHITEMVKGKPIFVMTWPGTDPKLPSLLLNSHTDVVPVFPESWKYDPFEAFKDENGDIYARGTQVRDQILDFTKDLVKLLMNSQPYKKRPRLSGLPTGFAKWPRRPGIPTGLVYRPKKRQSDSCIVRQVFIWCNGHELDLRFFYSL